jgi:glucose dehydrogenase
MSNFLYVLALILLLLPFVLRRFATPANGRTQTIATVNMWMTIAGLVCAAAAFAVDHLL